MREDIDELAASKKSIMPEGFEEASADHRIERPAGLPHPAGQVSALALDLSKAATIVSTRAECSEDVDSKPGAAWSSPTGLPK